MTAFRVIAAVCLCLSALATRAAAQDPRELVMEGISLYRDGRYEDAAERYSSALAIDPDNASALNNRALALVWIGDLETARADMSRALRKESANGALWNNRANVNCALKLVDESVFDRMRALYFGRFTASQAQVGLRNSGFYKGMTDGIWDDYSDQALADWTRAGCPNAPKSRLIMPD